MSLLNTDLTATDTSRPLLAEGLYELEVSECKEDVTSNGKPVLKINLRTLGDNPSADGKQTLHKGFPVFHMISLTQTEKYDPLKALKLFRQSALGPAGAQGVFGNPADYKGKIVKAKVRINPGGTNETTGQTYEPRNEIAAFLS